ncbi:hypothetical protein OKW34_001102 [Paraburkholderia youngii]
MLSAFNVAKLAVGGGVFLLWCDVSLSVSYDSKAAFAGLMRRGTASG